MRGSIKKEKIEKFDIIIIDGMNYLHKYLSVFRNLENSEKQKTGIYYGFFSLLMRLIRDYKNAEIILAWDKISTVRKNIDKYYKKDRVSTYEKLKKEKKELKRMLSLFGIKQFYAMGYEADDVAAKLVKINKNKKILLLSEDKDWFQLLSNKVKVMRKNKVRKEQIFSIEEIEEDHQIKIRWLTLYKSIIGDRGDGVYGVPYVNKFQVKKFCDKIDGDISRIYSITRLKGFQRIKNKIIMEFGRIEKNYQLVKLYTNYNLEAIEVLKDYKKLKILLKRYELGSIINKMRELGYV